eukprot:gb/GEZN01027555.1/.p2 GENE.gb/GEZN01027555.1/~~gb/GEZN01027555.1/.p2  ORF type:complete len:126 (-),score=15.23 gb/GEZN01027555.1/:67-444(-)
MSDRPPGSAHLSYSMAGVMSLGGIIGYVKAKSLPSLLGGLTIGAAYAVSGYLIQSGESQQGHLVGSAASAAVIGIFGKSAIKSGQLGRPALFAGLGAGSLAYHGAKAYEWSDFGKEDESKDAPSK